jgi:integrase
VWTVPRKRKWPPAIYHHSPSGTDRIRIYVVGADGKEKTRDLQLGPTGSDQARQAYLRLISQMDGNRGKLPALPAGDLTIRELLSTYTHYADGYYSASQVWRIRRALKPLWQQYAHTSAMEFGPLALKAVRQQFLSEGLSRRYINHLVGCIRRLFGWAAAEELVGQAVAEALYRTPDLRKRHTEAPESPAVKPAELAHVEATLPYLLPPLAAMVKLQRFTGMRPGEACVMRPCDLRRPWRTIDGVIVWLYDLVDNPSGHKSEWRGLPRQIPLGPRAQAVLAPFLERDPLAYCFSPREAVSDRYRRLGRVKDEDWEYSRAPGERYTTQVYDRAVRRACARAGVPPWSPNQLRHLVGTEIEVAYNRDTARCVLGHLNPQTTGIYAESVEKAAVVIARMG